VSERVDACACVEEGSWIGDVGEKREGEMERERARSNMSPSS